MTKREDQIGEDFAMVFQTLVGQVLVKIDESEEGTPEVRVYLKPKGLGMCRTAFGFTDDDDGWAKAERLFKDFDIEKATIIGEELIRMTSAYMDE